MGIKQSFQGKLTGKLRARPGRSSLLSQALQGTLLPRRVRCPHLVAWAASPRSETPAPARFDGTPENPQSLVKFDGIVRQCPRAMREGLTRSCFRRKSHDFRKADQRN